MQSTKTTSHHCSSRLLRPHGGSLLCVTMVLFLLPVATEGWSPKSILWLIRLKNMKFYNMNDGLFTPSAVSVDLDSKCQQYDAWLDPLRGSTPAEVPEGLLQELPVSWQQTVIDTITQEDLVRIAGETIPVLVTMLDTYQGTGLFVNWRTREPDPQESFMPSFLWRRPWSLEERPGDMYRILSTYSRILHYYGCILDDEHSRKRSLPEDNQYGNLENNSLRIRKALSKRTEKALWSLIGNLGTKTVQKRVLGIDNEEHFSTLGQNFYQMLGHLFLTLPDTSPDVVRTLTINHDVQKAITKMRSSDSIGVRVYYRAMLCVELHQLMVAIIDQQSWQSGDKATDPEVNLLDILTLEDRLKQKIKLENQLLKEMEDS